MREIVELNQGDCVPAQAVQTGPNGREARRSYHTDLGLKPVQSRT